MKKINLSAKVNTGFSFTLFYCGICNFVVPAFDNAKLLQIHGTSCFMLVTVRLTLGFLNIPLLCVQISTDCAISSTELSKIVVGVQVCSYTEVMS